MKELHDAITAAVKSLFNVDLDPELNRPEEKFGDYATNIALRLSGRVGESPKNIAAKLEGELQSLEIIEKIEIAGPGFINFTLTNSVLAAAALRPTKLAQNNNGKEILVEFGDPNPFKEMHIGHLYSYIFGDAISGLLEATGATVRRLSYHGDVGLHVAKAIYGMNQLNQARESRPLEAIQGENWQAFIDLGEAYAKGAQAYEEDEDFKHEIEEINRHIYEKDNDDINKIYEEGKKRSFADFDKVLDSLGIKNDKRYLESQSTPVGVEYVKKNIGKVFKESEGAVIYEGEKVGLHTRVFITSKGLPTYEAKDLGLAELKNRDFPEAARSIIITANEQAEYFKVMLAALAEIDKDLADKTMHMSHGFVSLTTGKMSSRTGDIYSSSTLLDGVRQETKQQYPQSDVTNDVYLAAVKYAFLKHRLGGDIVYDPGESVSLEGNSGPYIQYAHARAMSILSKAGESREGRVEIDEFEPAERSLARKISEYPEAVAKATEELMPHHICTYLYELAQKFNQFYEQNRVVGHERQGIRVRLIEVYADVLKSGLSLLNIVAPNRM
jgi:arginyl-tRNA synthetase